MLRRRIFENLLLMMLLAPVLVFIGTWFSLVWAVPAILGISWSVYVTVLEKSNREIIGISIHTILSCALIAVIISLFLGVGGVGYQNWDHEKHNAVLNDLINSSWPVFYDDRPLVYYLPYYILPALLGKVIGGSAGHWALYFQIVLFLFLFIVLFVSQFRKQVLGYVFFLFFLMFSGMDIVGIFIKGIIIVFPQHIEWWTSFNYMSMSTQLFWIPGVVMATWGGMVLLDSRGTSFKFISLLLSLVFIWSPYTAIGLVPFVGLLIFENQLKFSWKGVFPLVPALILAALFFSLKGSGVRTDAIWMYYETWYKYAGDYFLFVFLEFGILSVLLLTILPWNRKLILVISVLAILPVMIAPGIADFIMKCSMPSLYALAIILFREVDYAFFRCRRTMAHYLILVVFLFGVSTPVFEWGRAIVNYKITNPYRASPNQLMGLKPDWLPLQYLGRPAARSQYLLR